MMSIRAGEGNANSAPEMPSVAVIVLNWNGRDDTIACLESLDKVEYPRFDVVVVDNGSSDGSVAAIRQRFPRLEVVETGLNLGFAEGNNVGIRLALARHADYVFLLNNDTVVHPLLLKELVSAAERCPEGGIFSAKIFWYAEPARIWYAGVAWDERKMEFRHMVDETMLDERGVIPTDYACGCALLAKSATLRKIGLLDPKFFLTFEESDFCYRARSAGIGCFYVPAAIVWHKISVSFGGAASPLAKYFMTRNRLLWGERHLQVRQLVRLYKITWWELWDRFLPHAAPDRSRGTASRLWQSVSGFMGRCKEPTNQAVAWGVLHYLIRRFGDAPRHIRDLAGTPHTKKSLP
jgi:GT2 family glycosyltransferase